MYAIIVLLIFGFLVYRHGYQLSQEMSVVPRRLGDRLARLWEIAHHGMRENRFLPP